MQYISRPRTMHILRIVAVFAFALAIRGTQGASLPQDTQSVAMIDADFNFQFAPPTLVIPVGTTVTWNNDGTLTHTATSDTPGLFDTGNVIKGQSMSITFNTAGTFPYHCIYHGSLGMVGTITVVGSAPSTWLPFITHD